MINKNRNVCNGCGSRNIIYFLKKLIICNNCLLVSAVKSIKLKKFNKKNIRQSIKYKWLSDAKSKYDSEEDFVYNKIVKTGIELKEKHFNKFLEFSKIKKKDFILDFGSGYGPFLNEIKKKYNVIGLEPNKDSYLFSKKLGHKVINKYLGHNLFLPETFKLIYCRTVLTYISDIKKTFEIFNKILKKSLFIIQCASI